jgi:hypothetical protein
VVILEVEELVLQEEMMMVLLVDQVVEEIQQIMDQETPVAVEVVEVKDWEVVEDQEFVSLHILDSLIDT